jgi:hypothetical protein
MLKKCNYTYIKRKQDLDNTTALVVVVVVEKY